MSATLGALLRLVEPDWSITLIERLDGAAAESSDPWNNAGTGHSALCELNYTPRATRRLHRHQQGGARQRAVPGVAAVLVVRRGERRAARRPQLPQPDPARELRARRRQRRLPASARYDALVTNPLFASMEFIDDARRVRPPAAADGRQARLLRPGRAELDAGRHRRRLRFAVAAAHRLRRPARHDHAVRPRGARPAARSPTAAGRSRCVNRRTGAKRKINAKFVFVGAGGGALPLLQKSGIKEAKGFGGFPVGGAVPAHRQPGADRRAPGQGVRPAAAGRPADVGAAPGHPRHQRQVVAAVRPVRRLVAEVPQAGQGHRPAVLGQAEQPGVDAGCRRSPRWAW